MNQFRCKQLKSTVVLGFKIQFIGLSTVTVEKGLPFQEELPDPQVTPESLRGSRASDYERQLAFGQ
jgi:hypothetical protein